jgi:putative ABC transport system ATP-binding protein
MLEIKNLKLRTIKNLSYSHALNQKTLVLGPSGSGKSTFLEFIREEVPAESGQMAKKFLTSQTLFQDDNLISKLSALENAQLVLNQEQIKLFQKILNELKISEVDKLVKNFSSGEQQLIAIALCLAFESEMLLADEPTSNLDPEMALIALQVILKYSQSLILVSHDFRFKKHFEFILDFGAN